VSLATIQDWLLNLEGFKRQYEVATARHVSSQFALSTSWDTPDWSYLLLCASILAPHSDGTMQDAALRLAHACLDDPESTSEQRASAIAVLHSLLNQPSMELAEKRGVIPSELESQLPFPLQQDWARRRSEAGYELRPNESILLNHFQLELLQRSQDDAWIAVSAPTSAGKSFALIATLRQLFVTASGSKVAYVVPTRALVSQVARDVQQGLSDLPVKPVVVTLPWADFSDEGATLFVLTQERLHVLLNRRAQLQLDHIVVDEAQKVGDGNRGILLQQAISKSLSRNSQLNVLFAMPLSENPGDLLVDGPPNQSKFTINRDERTVNHNLLWASQLPRRSDRWHLELIVGQQRTELGEFDLPSRPSPASKRLPFVAYSLGDSSGGNLIYANTAAEAEKMAMQLYDVRGSNATNASSDIRDLMELIRQTVHPQYALRKVLSRGIGFHYGSMPQLIRQSLEDLFRSGQIQYMVCTSTLIEGVNLACKSIYTRGPSKGRGSPMSESDFWNMGGRAGRWGKEFQGNIVCVDPDDSSVWKVPVPRIRKRGVVVRSLDALVENPEQLASYMSDGINRPPSSSESPLAYATSFLTSSMIEDGNLVSAPWASRYDPSKVSLLERAVRQVLDSISVSSETIGRNPGVDPFGLARLKEQFRSREASGEKKCEDWLLADPGSQDMVGRYTSALVRLNRAFGDLFGNEKRCVMLALLMRDWMQGFQLSRIIESRLARYPDLKLANVIRDCMRDVEEYARFRGPKYLRAYNHVLKEHLLESGKEALAAEIEDYEFQLELGVSIQTQLSLMAIGLSRSTAITLSELIADSELSEDDCRNWLATNRWMVESVPALAQKEVSTLLTLDGPIDQGDNRS